MMWKERAEAPPTTLQQTGERPCQWCCSGYDCSMFHDTDGRCQNEATRNRSNNNNRQQQRAAITMEQKHTKPPNRNVPHRDAGTLTYMSIAKTEGLK
jgi:hypothetical protein